MYHVLYPEDRIVTDQTVLAWGQDEWDTNPQDDRPETAEEAKELLEDRGIVTFGA
jgi:hypothetical protein